MRKRKIIKSAAVLLIVATMVFSSVALAANTKESSEISTKENKTISKSFDAEKSTSSIGRGIVFEDDFESYADFVLDFPPWIQVDVDGSSTYGHNTYDWENEHYTGSYIIFNPSATTPPMDDHTPHSGDKYAACFNAVLPATNDDWLITPQLNAVQFDTVSFWARAYTSDYNLDRFRVGVSTTDTNPSSFTIISTEPYIEAPAEWTEYVFDIKSYSGDIYIAINCVSYDGFWLCIDDFVVHEVQEQCEPAIDVECYVWDPELSEWKDADTENEAVDLPICEEGQKKITIHNSGDCPLYEIHVMDQMHDSLEYISANPEPDNVAHDPPYYYLDWHFDGPLMPCEIIEIIITFHVVGEECSIDVNHVEVTAVCEHGITVTDADDAYVHCYKPSRSIDRPFLQLIEKYPNLFQLIQKLLQRLGL